MMATIALLGTCQILEKRCPSNTLQSHTKNRPKEKCWKSKVSGWDLTGYFSLDISPLCLILHNDNNSNLMMLMIVIIIIIMWGVIKAGRESGFPMCLPYLHQMCYFSISSKACPNVIRLKDILSLEIQTKVWNKFKLRKISPQSPFTFCN